MTGSTPSSMLEARAAFAEDVSAAVVSLIANLKSEKSTIATSEWRQQVNGICDKHGREHLALLATEE